MDPQPLQCNDTARDVMAVLYRADERLPGSQVSSRLEPHSNVTQTSRENALRRLRDRGLVDAVELDGRSLGYQLSDDGREAYEADLQWRQNQSDSGASPSANS